MSSKKVSKLSICGPLKDGHFTVWVVRGPKGRQLGEFASRTAAQRYVKTHKTLKEKKELLHVAR